MRDPFSDDADPLRLDGARAPDPEGGEPQQPARTTGRRTIILSVLMAPAALAVAGCIHPRLACRTVVGDPAHCQHRFCRYHGQVTPYGIPPT